MVELFGDVVFTAQGDTIAAAGFAEKGWGDVCRRQLQALEALSFPSADPYQIDSTLVDALKNALPAHVTVIGASVRVHEGLTPYCPSGGVIGDLYEESSSSDGRLQRLPCGMLLFTRPGGPGFAAMCPKSLADSALRQLPEQDSHGEAKDGAPTLIRFFDRNEIDRYIVVSDGSGLRGPGIVAARMKAEKLYFRI